MLISVSIRSITAQVLAQSALRSLSDGLRPPMLNPDQTPALRALAKGAFALVCLTLSPALTDCRPDIDIDDPAADLLQLETDDSRVSNPVALRLLIEHTVGAHMLAEIYAGVDDTASGIFTDDFESSLITLRNHTRPRPDSARIRPYRP